MNTTIRHYLTAVPALVCLALSPAVSASIPSEQISIPPPSAHLESYRGAWKRAFPHATPLPNPKKVTTSEYLRAVGFGAPDVSSSYENTVAAMNLYHIADELIDANQPEKAGEYLALSMSLMAFALKKEAVCEQPDWYTMNDLIELMSHVADAPVESGAVPDSESAGVFYENISSLLFEAHLSMKKHPGGKKVTSQCFTTACLFLEKAAEHGNTRAANAIRNLNP